MSRDIISTIPYQTPGAFSYARYQAGAYDFQLNPRDPAAALQNLGAYTNPLRERYGNGGTNIPASQAWSPSPNYGFAYSTMNQNGRQWNDGSDFFYAATYMQIDSEAAGQGYDMVSGKYRGGQFYTRHTKIVTGNTDPASGRSPGNFQRACASVAVTWFPYSQGWKAGYFDSWASGSIKYDIVDGNPHWKYGDGWGMHSGTALHGSPDGTYQSSYNSPSNILSWIPTTDQSGNPTFLAQLTLPGVNSKTDGMLFTLGNQEGNGDRGPSAQNAALNDGSGWYVAVRDIEDSKLDPTSYATGNHADSAFSFLYVPYNANNLIGGHIAANGSKIKSAGNFTVQHITNGIYAITIPGKTGTNGVLMLQNTGYLAKQPTGYSNIVDNSFLSYEYGGTNVPSNAFIVNAVAVDPTGIDGTGTPGHEGTVKLQDAEFNFVYVDFLNPLTVPEPKLTLTRSGSNVTLSWDSATPAVLQSTTSLKAPVTWTDIGSANPSAPIAITGKAQYFRLRH